MKKCFKWCVFKNFKIIDSCYLLKIGREENFFFDIKGYEIMIKKEFLLF